jgi:ketosteroid isomerase-like protein
MREKTLGTWVILSLLILFLSAANAEDKKHPEYDVVKKTIEDSIGWAIEKDFDYLFSIMADDENLFHLWLTSDSQLIGIEAFKKFSERWKTPDFRGTRFEFKQLRINFSRSGDVVWYSTYLDDCGEFSGKEFCLEDVFQTGVLEKRDGRWVHVQIHGSYPVDKVPEAYIKRYHKHLLKNGGKGGKK